MHGYLGSALAGMLPFLCAAGLSGSAAGGDEMLTPVIDGRWWQIAGDPDLGKYTRKEQQPVDFAVWQAADGTWQLWSCIRRTGCGGHTRLFYRWEGKRLTDEHWKPMGIAMEADVKLGECAGGLQAPHVVLWNGAYHMAYGDWERICFATSKDGKTFRRVVRENGKTGAFGEGPGSNTRDPMLIRIGGLWHCYYTGGVGNQGFVFCRTSPDLKTWSHACVVCYGGKTGKSPWSCECPHVAEPEPGVFFLFRNERYGEDAKNWVYRSPNPLNFGINDNAHLVRGLHVAAPEIIRHDGQWYIASLLDSLKGIKIARLKWVRLAELGRSLFDFDDAAVREKWRLKKGDLEPVFTCSKRSDFSPPTRHFIGTAERSDSKLNDDFTCRIESPPFVLEKSGYTLLVSGGSDTRKVYVAIADAETGEELARFGGGNGNRFERKRLDCSRLRGREVIINVVDEAKGSWGHINFGGIYEDPLAEHEE